MTMDPGSTSLTPESRRVTDSGDKEIVLPKQLEAVTKATEFPLERHRWNTNEEVAGILIAFDHHQQWQSREVKLRPASGSMLLYNRKKVRYRKDGYCWKKRKDGKTTREDHMKLKVQGVECIYGCYVHSAILPTFHRRCYWLLQNPDLVLVHYLNVPLPDDNKLSLPNLIHITEKKEWSRDELICQLRPMFVGASGNHHSGVTSSQLEETVQSMVSQLMESRPRVDCICTSSSTTCDSPTCKNKCRVISPKTQSTTAAVTAAIPAKSSLVMPGVKPGMHHHHHHPHHHHNMNTVTTTSAQQRPVMTAGGASLIINSSGGQRQLGANTPLILNLSQLQGSNGLIILSSQTNAPISIVNNGLLGNSVSTATTTTTTTTTSSGSSTGHALSHTTLQAVVTPTTIPNNSLHSRNSLETLAHSQQQGMARSAAGSAATGHGGARIHGQQIQLPGQVVGMSPGDICRNQPVESQGRDATNSVLGSHLIDGLTLKQEVEDDKSSMSMDDYQSHPHSVLGGQAPPTNGELRPRAGSIPCELEARMETTPPTTNSSNRSSLSNTPQQSTTMDDIVNELNVKNEMHNFNNIAMSQYDIQKALYANLPNSSHHNLDHTPQPNLDHTNPISANHSSVSLDSIEAMRTSMGSPQSTDFNFDAFETLLDVLPDFDSHDQMTSDLSTPTQSSSTPPSTSLPVATSTNSSPSPTPCSSCHTSSNLNEVKQENRAGIANITDFSPEWSFADGGVKVLVTGPWYSTTSPYTVLFDGNSVPATLVQSGVLRCFCPAHAPGLVTLQVACEGYVISNSCVFEYKEKTDSVKAKGQSQWFGIQEDHLKMALLNKLEQIERRLSTCTGRSALSNHMEGKMRSHDFFEVRLLDYVDQLSQCQWNAGRDVLPRAASGMTLLHLVAALGYTRLTLALIKWRSENPSLVLEAEVDALSRDQHEATPLMWACARGCLETAIVFYHWNPAALGICNIDQQSPLAAARFYGNAHIAEHIERLEIAQLPKPPPQQEQQHLHKQQQPRQQGKTKQPGVKSRKEGPNNTVGQRTALKKKGCIQYYQNIDTSGLFMNAEMPMGMIGKGAESRTEEVGHADFGLIYQEQLSLARAQESELLKKDCQIQGVGPISNPAHSTTVGHTLPPPACPSQSTSFSKPLSQQTHPNIHPTHHQSPHILDHASFMQGGVASNNKPAPPAWLNEMTDLTIEIPSPPPIFGGLPDALAHSSSQSTPSATHHRPSASEAGMSRSMRLLKRTSVEVLPGYLDISLEGNNKSSTKNAKTTEVHEVVPLPNESVDTNILRKELAPSSGNLTPTAEYATTATTTRSNSNNHHHTAAALDPHHGSVVADNTQLVTSRPPGCTTSVVTGVGHQGLRPVSSDPHLVNLGGGAGGGVGVAGVLQGSQMLLYEDNPMISVNDRDLNSPVMFMQTDALLSSQSSGLTLEDIQRETVAMETDSPRSDSPYVNVERLSEDDDDLHHTSMSFLEQLFQSVGAGTEEAQNQIVTLANQIIAAMPERIKLSPPRFVENMVVDATPGGLGGAVGTAGGGDAGAGGGVLGIGRIILGVGGGGVGAGAGAGGQRERSSSHSSFSSFSSSATPPCGADDSGISTPLEGLAFEEYRYPDLGTPASSLSPASSCLQSPYSFTLDSPPPTTAEFTEYFNAPATFMEKDFSQLTLSDHEQRRLYEAAKIIQNFYRHYKDKKQQAQKQRQREIEAAILIQSYYRRYKQYAYYKKMTQAAVLIQSQFRSYYAQKRFKRSRQAATVIQNQYRTYKEHERFKKSRNAAVIIQQRFRSHYQRKRSQEMARQVQKAVKSSSHSSESRDTPIDEVPHHSTDDPTSAHQHSSSTFSADQHTFHNSCQEEVEEEEEEEEEDDEDDDDDDEEEEEEEEGEEEQEEESDEQSRRQPLEVYCQIDRLRSMARRLRGRRSRKSMDALSVVPGSSATSSTTPTSGDLHCSHTSVSEDNNACLLTPGDQQISSNTSGNNC